MQVNARHSLTHSGRGMRLRQTGFDGIKQGGREAREHRSLPSRRSAIESVIVLDLIDGGTAWSCRESAGCVQTIGCCSCWTSNRRQGGLPSAWQVRASEHICKRQARRCPTDNRGGHMQAWARTGSTAVPDFLRWPPSGRRRLRGWYPPGVRRRRADSEQKPA